MIKTTKIGTATIITDLIADKLEPEDFDVTDSDDIYYESDEEIKSKKILVKAGTVVDIIQKTMTDWLKPEYIKMPNGDLVSIERIEHHISNIRRFD